MKTSLSPLLSVRNGAKALDFYTRALGATILSRMDGESGDVVAKLSVDGAEFWLADESSEHLNFSPDFLKGSSVRMILTVENPDAIFDKIVAQGAEVICPMEDQPYGWRVGRVQDPFGHHWEIGKPLH